MANKRPLIIYNGEIEELNSSDSLIVPSGSITTDGAESRNIADLSVEGHGHTISDVTNLQTELNGKSDTGHNHAISDVTGLDTALSGKADTSHNHAISDITDLQDDLDGKADTSHNHAWSDLNDFTGSSIDDVADVTITSPLDGQALLYEDSGSTWKNATLGLNCLNDVYIDGGSLANGCSLRYNSTSSKWEVCETTSGASAFTGLSDTPSTHSAGCFLCSDGYDLVWTDPPSGVTTFIGLNDTPGAFGGADCYVAINGMNDGLTFVSPPSSNYLPLSGGTMSGDIDMGGNDICNVGNSSIIFANGSKIHSDKFDSDGCLDLSGEVDGSTISFATTGAPQYWDNFDDPSKAAGQRITSTLWFPSGNGNFTWASAGGSATAPAYVTDPASVFRAGDDLNAAPPVSSTMMSSNAGVSTISGIWTAKVTYESTFNAAASAQAITFLGDYDGALGLFLIMFSIVWGPTNVTITPTDAGGLLAVIPPDTSVTSAKFDLQIDVDLTNNLVTISVDQLLGGGMIPLAGFNAVAYGVGAQPNALGSIHFQFVSSVSQPVVTVDNVQLPGMSAPSVLAMAGGLADLNDVYVISPTAGHGMVYVNSPPIVGWVNSTIRGEYGNGGEPTGSNRSLGNTDAYSLEFMTDAISRLCIESGGDICAYYNLDVAENVTATCFIGDGSFLTNLPSSGDYLPLAGGDMSGDIDMCGNDILNIGNSSLTFVDNSKICSCAFTTAGKLANLNQIAGVCITSPAEDSVLKWCHSQSCWVDHVAYLSDAKNVSTATPSAGNVLQWNGSVWAPAALSTNLTPPVGIYSNSNSTCALEATNCYTVMNMYMDQSNEGILTMWGETSSGTYTPTGICICNAHNGIEAVTHGTGLCIYQVENNTTGICVQQWASGGSGPLPLGMCINGNGTGMCITTGCVGMYVKGAEGPAIIADTDTTGQNVAICVCHGCIELDGDIYSCQTICAQKFCTTGNGSGEGFYANSCGGVSSYPGALTVVSAFNETGCAGYYLTFCQGILVSCSTFNNM